MIESLIVDGYAIHRANDTYVSLMTFGTPEPRIIRAPRPRRHGAVDLTHLYAGRVVPLEGWCGGDTHAATRAAYDTLKATLTVEDEHLLVFRRSGMAEDEQLVVRLAAPVDEQRPTLAAPLIEWAVDLIAPDPRIYAAAQQVEYFVYDEISQTGVDATNGGTFQTQPLIRVHGPFGNVVAGGLEAVNTTTGERLVVEQTTLQAGDVMLIDFAARTLKIDTTANGGSVAELPQLIDPVETTWWSLVPGLNAIDFPTPGSGIQTGETSFDVVWHDARI